jgi:hypothetical protein
VDSGREFKCNRCFSVIWYTEAGRCKILSYECSLKAYYKEKKLGTAFVDKLGKMLKQIFFQERPSSFFSSSSWDVSRFPTSIVILSLSWFMIQEGCRVILQDMLCLVRFQCWKGASPIPMYEQVKK